jgi:hypothetical protein
MLTRATLAAVVVFVACKTGDSYQVRPLELKRLPQCPKWAYGEPVVFRLERGNDYLQQPYPLTPTGDEPHFDLLSSWSPGKVTFKLGTCPEVDRTNWDCAQARWLVTSDVELIQDDHGYSLTVPEVSLSCRDGSRVSN